MGRKANIRSKGREDLLHQPIIIGNIRQKFLKDFKSHRQINRRLILAMTLIAGLLLAEFADAKKIPVSPIPVPGNYQRIQDAIAAAADGDDIILGKGEYREHDISFLGKAIRVKGYRQESVINAEGLGSGFLFENGEGEFSVLSGVTVKGGLAERGGGILIDGASPTIEHVTLTENEAQQGGGLYYRGGTQGVYLKNVTISNNRATGGEGVRGDGGGIYINDGWLFVINSNIVENRATGYGGGFYSNRYLKMWDSKIEKNRSLWGGGIYAEKGDGDLFRVRICENTTMGGGGGFAVDVAKYRFHECFIARNTAETGPGAGLLVTLSGGITVKNSIITANRTKTVGGGLAVYNEGIAWLHHCTVSGNLAEQGGSGIYSYESGKILIDYSILWDEGASEIIPYPSLANIQAKFSDIRGGWPGQGNIGSDPQFDTDGFHIKPGSPVIDKITQHASKWDFDGQPRPWGSADDMGADEYHAPATIRHVPDDYKSIQEAIDAARHGDHVVLKKNITYLEHSIDFKNKWITVRSQDPKDNSVAASTVVDAGKKGRVFTMQIGTLSGLTIKGGDVNGPGGGVYCPPGTDQKQTVREKGLLPPDTPLFPRIENCRVEGNHTTDSGGGIYAPFGVVRKCRISNNRADNSGGGAYAQIIEDCTISRNRAARYGSGVYAEVVRASRITENGTEFVGKEGGGVYVAYLVENCKIERNNASLGAGIYCSGLSGQKMVVRDSVIRNNPFREFASQGGGIYAYGELTLIGNDIIQNRARAGGGIYITGNIYPITILGGTIQENLGGSYGGGLLSERTITISGVDIRGNKAERGGGVHLEARTGKISTIRRCLIRGNTADVEGGGLYSLFYPPGVEIYDTVITGNTAEFGGGICSALHGSSMLSNTTISNNSAIEGGGIYADKRHQLTVRNCTFTANTARGRGAAVFCKSGEKSTLLTHSIFWGNEPDEIFGFYHCESRVKYSDVRGGWPGEGNINADPMFVAPDTGDFHLRANSPCIDSGSSENTATVDIDGDPRPLGHSVDMGIDEVGGAWHHPVVSSIAPATGSFDGGETLRITGNGLGGFSKVLFKSPQVPAAEARVVDASLRHLEVETPIWRPHTGFADVVVDNGKDPKTGTHYRVEIKNGFEFVQPPRPVLTAATPDFGGIVGGDRIRLSGKNFRKPMRVLINDAEVKAVAFLSSEALDIVTPPSATAGHVDVKIIAPAGETDTLISGFRYMPSSAPRIVTVSPPSGSALGGETVQLQGKNFVGLFRVFFGAGEIPLVRVVSTEVIEVVTPAHDGAGPVDVVVRDEHGQTAVLKGGFTYQLPPPPVLNALSPQKGTNNGGKKVVISGDHFTDPMTVRINAAEVGDVTVVSDTELNITTDPRPDSGIKNLLAVDRFGQASNVLPFEYTAAAAPVITAVDPPMGTTAGGEPVTIRGSNFSRGVRLVLKDQIGAGSMDVPVTFRGTSTLEFITPAHISEVDCMDTVVDVILTNPNGAVGTAGFTYSPVQVIRVSRADSIQAAIDAAAHGACILLETYDFPGYQENLDFGEKIISMYGGDPNDPTKTVISARIPSLPTVQYAANKGSGTLLRGVAVLLGNAGIACEGSSPKLENLLIQNNAAKESGGGIAVRAGSSPAIKDSTIAFNTSGGSGGGIYVDQKSKATFSGQIKILNNEAKEQGGGLWLPDKTTLRLSNSTVNANTSKGEGAGIYVGPGSDVQVFENNHVDRNTTAKGFGAGIYIGKKSTANIFDSSFDENRGADGGGIWIGSGSTITIEKGSASENLSSGPGAGICLGDQVKAGIRGVKISGNQGTDENAFGGGIHAGIFLSGHIEGCMITGNEAQQGGGIFLKYKSSAVIRENEVSYNIVSQHGTGKEPPPVFGPGIYASDSLSPFLNNTVAFNTATGAKEPTGGIHVNDPFMFPEVINNILAGNAGSKTYGLFCSTAELMGEVSHNLFFGNAAGSAFGCGTGTNPIVGQDPLFVNPAPPAPDLHITAGSPAIGAGKEGVDIGAYPF